MLGQYVGKDCDLKSCLGMGHPNQSKCLFLAVSHFGCLFLNGKMTAWVNDEGIVLFLLLLLLSVCSFSDK